MAKIPLPSRGQPLDLTYIYQLVSAINDLSDQVSTSTYKYVTIDTEEAGRQSVKASEARIIGGYEEVINNASVNAGDTRDFTYDFPVQFKYAPIVTATPKTIRETDAGKDVTVILTSVTVSRIEGVVRFNTSGDASLGVNLNIVGIPN